MTSRRPPRTPPRAAAKAPSRLAALHAAAIGHHKGGRLKEASEGYRACLALAPRDASLWTNLGAVLRARGLFPTAAACQKRAHELSPDNPGICSNLGNVLKDLGRVEEAVALQQRAVALDPRTASYRHNLGIACREAGRFEESVAALDEALKLEPGNRTIEWDRAQALLALGRFAEGWQAYEARWALGKLQNRRPELPLWSGEEIAGKTILVMVEQGFGDCLLGARFLPLLKARGARVWLEAKPPLRPLFEGQPYVDRLIDPEEAAGGADLSCPLMSLPGRLSIDLGNLPPPPPLTLSEAAEARMAKLLAPLEGYLKVGIVWSGSQSFAGNRNRAVTLERFLPLAEIPGLRLVSLQKGPPERELKDWEATPLILDLAPHLETFADTAAACRRLDLVVMTDSAVAHVAGSLGVPVWNLLCFVPYWLYLWERADTPWYPSMRLFRQSRPGDWDAVFAQVRAALEKLAVEKRRG